MDSPDTDFILRDDLVAHMAAQGWELCFVHYEAWWNDWSQKGVTPLPPVGPLDSDVLLLAWPVNPANSALFKDIFERGDMDELQSIRQTEANFCTCPIAPSRPKSEHDTFETHYYFQLSGRSGAANWEFTHAVWEAIGELSHGECVNPQD